jgi:hypothetical protein
MAQDFTSFGHGNTVFREKNRHVICITLCKRLVVMDYPPSFKLLPEGQLDISRLIYHALGRIIGVVKAIFLGYGMTITSKETIAG